MAKGGKHERIYVNLLRPGNLPTAQKPELLTAQQLKKKRLINFRVFHFKKREY